MTTDIWKLQDAKARFSELVRRARAGEPQHVTVHGEEAVVVVDPKRFDISPKTAGSEPEIVQAKPPEPSPVKAVAPPPVAPSPVTAPEPAPPEPTEKPAVTATEMPVPKAPEPPAAPALIPMPAPLIPRVERAPEPAPTPTPDAAALDLIAELELELRRLKEPLPEPPRRGFRDYGK